MECHDYGDHRLTKFSSPEVVEIDSRGESDEIAVVEWASINLFEIARIYWIANLQSPHRRGFHAHKTLFQAIFCISGEISLTVRDDTQIWNFTLSHEKRQFLVLPPGYWREFEALSNDSTLLVLASDKYDEDDYIRSFDDYIQWRQSS